MHLAGEHQVPAPRERVWRALADPAVLRDCLPPGSRLATAADGMTISSADGSFQACGSIREPHTTLGWTIDPSGAATQMVLVRLAERGAFTRLSYELSLVDPAVEATPRLERLQREIEQALLRLSRHLAGPAEIGAQGVAGMVQAATEPASQPTARLAPEAAPGLAPLLAACLTPQRVGGAGFVLVLLALLGLI